MAPKSTVGLRLEGSEDDQIRSTSIHLQELAKDDRKNQSETDEGGGSACDHGIRSVLLLSRLFGQFFVGYVRSLVEEPTLPEISKGR